MQNLKYHTIVYILNYCIYFYFNRINSELINNSISSIFLLISVLMSHKLRIYKNKINVNFFLCIFMNCFSFTIFFSQLLLNFYYYNITKIIFLLYNIIFNFLCFKKIKYIKKEYKICYLTNEICSICLDSHISTDLLIISECNHIFHKNCILKWLSFKENCPNCRKYLNF